MKMKISAKGGNKEFSFEFEASIKELTELAELEEQNLKKFGVITIGNDGVYKINKSKLVDLLSVK